MKILYLTLSKIELHKQGIYSDLINALSSAGHEVTVLQVCEPKDTRKTTLVTEGSIRILKVVVGRHVIDEAVHIICDGVVGDVHEYVDVLSSGGIYEYGVTLSRSEARNRDGESVILFIIPLIGGIIPVLIVVAQAKITDPFVDLFPEGLSGGENDQRKRSYRIAGLFELIMQGENVGHVNLRSGALSATK